LFSWRENRETGKGGSYILNSKLLLRTTLYWNLPL